MKEIIKIINISYSSLMTLLLLLFIAFIFQTNTLLLLLLIGLIMIGLNVADYLSQDENLEHVNTIYSIVVSSLYFMLVFSSFLMLRWVKTNKKQKISRENSLTGFLFRSESLYFGNTLNNLGFMLRNFPTFMLIPILFSLVVIGLNSYQINQAQNENNNL